MDLCRKQCLKKERQFMADQAEICIVKCYDLGFVYMRQGLHELN